MSCYSPTPKCITGTNILIPICMLYVYTDELMSEAEPLHSLVPRPTAFLLFDLC